MLSNPLSLQVVLETLAGQRAVRMHGAKTKYLVSLPRRGREGGRQGRREGGREALLLTTNRCSPEGWNDLECSTPQKPGFAAADSSLKVGRAQTASFTLLRRNLSFFYRCTGLF